MKSGDRSGCKDLPLFISSLCLKGFLIGDVLLSILDIQMVALDMMLLLTPPETIPKYGEAVGDGRKQGSHNSSSAHNSKRWKVFSLGRGKQHHGQVVSRCGTKTAESLLKSDLPFSTSAAPSQTFPGILSGMGEEEGQT